MSTVLLAHPARIGSVAHEPPRLSASAGERHMACGSSLAREWEYFQWAADSGISGLASGPEANRGVMLHAVLGAIPFAGRDHGEVPFNVRERVEGEAKRLGAKINSYEAWLCTRFIERRDEFVEWLIDQHPDGRAAIDEIELILDDTRLGTDFTGTPDVIAVVAGNGKAIAGVADYKTGQGQHKEAAENMQLAINARLVQERKGPLGRPAVVYTVVLTEAEISEPLQIGKYEESSLAEIGLKMVKAERVSLPLAEKVKAAPASIDLPKPLDALLDAEASFGSHCFRCKGKVCCGAMKIVAAQAAGKMYDIIGYAQKNPINPAMDTKKLSDGIAMSASMEHLQKIISAYREDAETLALQLHEKGVLLDDVKIEEGTKRVSLEETDVKSLHAKLAPVIEMSTGKALLFEQFAAGITEASKVSATGLRAFLAGQLGVPETKVVEQLASRMKALGVSSPLVQKPTSPSVKTTRDVSEVIDELALQTKHRLTEWARPASTVGSAAEVASKLEAEMAKLPASVAPSPSKRKSAKKPDLAPVEAMIEPPKPQGVALWG